MAIGTTLKISFDAKAVQRGLASMGSSIAGFGSKIAGIGLGTVTAGTAAAAAGFVAFTKASSDSAAEMETLQMQFETLTKSSAKAQEMIAQFRDEATKSPLSVKDYADAGKTLMAFGMSADKVLPTLKALGDVSMGNSERFGSLALAFAQTQAAGRLMGQEVLQFVNAGFNPLQEIARKTGKSMLELKKAMEEGKISAAMVADAFVSATSKGGLFYKAIERGATTTEGKIAKVKDAILSIRMAYGEGVNEGLKNALDAANNGIGQMEERFRSFGQRVGSIISDAVAGNFDKLVAVGRLIGDTISAAATAAYQAGSTGIVEGAVNTGKNIVRGATGGKYSLYQPEPFKGPSFDELFEAHLLLKGVAQQVKAIAEGTQGLVPGTNGKFRYAQPGESTPFRDANGARVVEVLYKIEHNTKAGAKM